MAKDGKKKRNVRRMRRMRLGRIPRAVKGTKADVAVVKQRFSTQANAMTFNSIYRAYNYTLKGADRASQVGQCYQEFRIKYIQMIFKPLVNLYNSNTVQNGSLPYLYYLIDKVGTMTNQPLNFNFLRDAGAKPLKFTDKPITVSYKPAVLDNVGSYGTSGANSANVGLNYARKVVSPWLNTNATPDGTGGSPASWTPSTIPHYGICFGVQQEVTSASQNQILNYDVDILIVYEFRKPRVFASNGPTVPTKTFDPLDNALQFEQ